LLLNNNFSFLASFNLLWNDVIQVIVAT
jgi:hypothetical protein